MISRLAIILLFCSQASQNLLVPKFNGIEEAIRLMTKDVVQRYFSECYCVGVIAENADLILYILEDVPIVSLEVSDIPKMNDTEEYGNLKEETSAFDKIMVELLDQKCLDFIIQVSTPEFLVEYFSRSSRRSAVRSNRQYLYLPVIEDEIILNPNSTSIFAMKEMAVMPDLVTAKIVSRDKNLQILNIEVDNETIDLDADCANKVVIEFLTHKYAAPNPEEEITLDTWTSDLGFSSQVNLYPNKMKNLQGKEMKLSTLPNYPPYVILDLNSTPPLYEGLELRCAKEFARLLNFTFQVIVDDDALWGEVWPNGTGNGLLGMVTMDIAVMGFGAAYAWLENYPYLDFSLPYFHSYIRCVTPRPKQLPGWMTPLLPFSPMMWAAMGISLIITVLALYLVNNAIILLLDERDNKRKYSTITTNIIMAWGLLLLQSPSEEKMPQYSPLRHLVTWLMVYFFLVNSIYSGGLASVLTVPRFEDPINTVADLAKSNMIWSAPSDVWIYSIKEATEPDLAHIVRNYRTLDEEELLKRAFRGDTAFAIERLLGGNYALPSYINNVTVPLLRAMRTDIYSGSPVFNVRKASPFLESLNMFILRLSAGGLVVNYEMQVVREFVGQRLQLVLAKNDQVSTDSGPVNLQVVHIQGPLFFLGFGLLAAFIVFTSEMMTVMTNRRFQDRKRSPITTRNIM